MNNCGTENGKPQETRECSDDIIDTGKRFIDDTTESLGNWFSRLMQNKAMVVVSGVFAVGIVVVIVLISIAMRRKKRAKNRKKVLDKIKEGGKFG